MCLEEILQKSISNILIKYYGLINNFNNCEEDIKYHKFLSDMYQSRGLERTNFLKTIGWIRNFRHEKYKDKEIFKIINIIDSTIDDDYFKICLMFMDESDKKS